MENKNARHSGNKEIQDSSLKQLLNCLCIQVCKSFQKISTVHTGAKILNLSKKSHIENHHSHSWNLIFDKIHISEISFFKKFTLLNLIFNKIRISEISFLTKFTFLKSHFSQNSHFWNIKSMEFLDELSIFAPVCCLHQYDFWKVIQVIHDVDSRSTYLDSLNQVL